MYIDVEVTLQTSHPKKKKKKDFIFKLCVSLFNRSGNKDETNDKSIKWYLMSCEYALEVLGLLRQGDRGPKAEYKTLGGSQYFQVNLLCIENNKTF